MTSDSRSYPPSIEIQPLTRPVKAVVSVPGSKSITNRALVLAAIRSSFGPCELNGALRSDDTEVMVDCLRRLGYRIETDWPTVRLLPHGADAIVPARSADFFVGNSGTTMRFLTALCAIGNGRFRLDGVHRMRERPIEDLLEALRACGVNAKSELGNGCPPVVIEGTGWLKGDGAVIRAEVSSQFASALLMVAPFNESGHFTLRLEGPVVSEPYIRMTEQMMREWGARWRTSNGDRSYLFDAESRINYCHNQLSYAIEPDASAASYFFAAAAITGGTVTVADLSRRSLQGDVGFVDILEQMGCRVEECSSGITLHGRPLHGIDVDMNAISDTVMTLGAVACFADSPTLIRNIAHIRHKETDRIAALASELRKVGADVEEFGDGLKITPRPIHGAEIETYDDHRMAMSMALIGLKAPGITIVKPGCVAKTYPDYWSDLERLRT
jgi:3-phosphoshikimate 1-carboxyvinyltransferase